MTYQEFLDRNEANKERYKKLIKHRKSPSSNSYICSTITDVDFNRNGGVVFFKSNIAKAYSINYIKNLVRLVCRDEYMHVINASKIKNWKGFEG